MHLPSIIRNGTAKELVHALPKDDLTKLIVKQAIEYLVIMGIKGVGSQLMTEIGDVTRFTHKESITAFAGVDPGVNESGT